MKELFYYKELRMKRGSIPVIHDCAVKYRKDSIFGVCHPLSSTRNWDVTSHLRKLQGNKEKSTSPWPQGNLSPLVERSCNTKPWTSLELGSESLVLQRDAEHMNASSRWLSDGGKSSQETHLRHMAKRIRPSISLPMLLKGTDTNNRNIP